MQQEGKAEAVPGVELLVGSSGESHSYEIGRQHNQQGIIRVQAFLWKLESPYLSEQLWYIWGVGPFKQQKDN